MISRANSESQISVQSLIDFIVNEQRQKGPHVYEMAFRYINRYRESIDKVLQENPLREHHIRNLINALQRQVSGSKMHFQFLAP